MCQANLFKEILMIINTKERMEGERGATAGKGEEGAEKDGRKHKEN